MISWIYSEADLSLTIPSKLPSMTWVPSSRPHSQSVLQYRTVGALPPLIKSLNAAPAFDILKPNKTSTSEIFVINDIAKILRFTFKKVYINYDKRKTYFLASISMQSKRLIIWYLFFLCLWVFIGYVYGIMQLLSSTLAIFSYSIIWFILHRIWKKLRSKTAYSFWEFFSIFLYKAAFYSSLLVLLVWSFVVYQNFISPAKMPQYTITNWKQTIIFQAMSHIASQEFYDWVEKDIRSNKKDGYVLYYEWVLPGSEKNNKDFNTALWIQFDQNIYDNFSKLYWVEAQDNNQFIWLVNNLDYNIDLSLDRVMDIYNKRINSQWINSWEEDTKKSSKVYDMNTQVLDTLSELWERELLVLRYINQSILNFIIKHEYLRNAIIEKVANKDIFSVILDDRNLHLVKEIRAREDEKIFITYGLMHFSWVLELLQKKDENWKIISTKYSDVIHQDY